MPNLLLVADGTRQATIPDEIWDVVRPLLQKTAGVGKPLQGKQIALRLHLSQPSVSTWIQGKGRPTYWNAQCVVRLIRDEFPEDAEIQASARLALGLLGDTLAAVEEAAQLLTEAHNVTPEDAWLVMRGLKGPDTKSFYLEALRVLGLVPIQERHAGSADKIKGRITPDAGVQAR